jgi:hypothetical protein
MPAKLLEKLALLSPSSYLPLPETAIGLILNFF